ncbi:MAG TPA: stage II sporulation protein M [Solirubrobacterales bacterium]|nr:stage II sporulation protein M [Solirubrobacterales bacterium]
MSSEVPSPPPASEGFVIAAGLRASRATLERWRRDPAPVLSPWFAGALAISVALLAAVWVVSRLTTPDPTPVTLPGINDVSGFDDYAHILGRNLLVLALHATACIAGFIAGSSLQQVAATKSGLSRIVHERAGPVAIAWVVAVTAFSLISQALGLGMTAASLSAQLGIGSGTLILTVLPHALLELTAVFLPLAAWLIASRRDEWEELLAATFATVALALPMLLVAALVELTIWPLLLEAVSPFA